MTEVRDQANSAAEDAASYQRIFYSTSLIGGASVVNILIGLVRMKLVAVLLGPAGVGLIGLYSSLMATAATVSQLGVGTVGTRQIAEAHAKSDAKTLAVARRALFWAGLALSLAGGLVIWLSRDLLARHVLGDAAASGAVAWLALGVALSVAAASQSAMIQGMRRVRDLALITVLSAVFGTIVGVPLIWWLGQSGVAAYVLLAPASAFMLGRVFMARLPKAEDIAITFADLAPQWKIFIRLGVPFMAASIVATGIDLWIRLDIQNRLGAEALGHFQASWTIAMQYVGFVLGAMAADYYPRLTGVICSPREACQLVNQQTEVALLLSGCAILTLLGFAPWVVALLYAADFSGAAIVLRWQALATVLKVASWPLGFVILAAGAGRTYFLAESTTLILMAGAISLLIPRFGLEAAGIGFFIAYAFYLPVVYAQAIRRIGFRWSSDVISAFALLSGLCLGTGFALWGAPDWGVIAGAVAVILYATFALRRLKSLGFDRSILDWLKSTLGGRRS